MISVPQSQWPEEFVDAATERSLLAAVTRGPDDLYWQLIDLLPSGAFAAEPAAWKALSDAREREIEAPNLPADWTTPDAEPEKVARHLRDLARRRRYAAALQVLGRLLPDRRVSADDLAAQWQEAAAHIEADMAEVDAGALRWGDEVLDAVLQDAEARRAECQATGKPVMGVPTGLPGLDRILHGLPAGLVLLAGPPKMGKTTLAMQIAAAVAAQGVPTVYCTFECSPEVLTRRVLAAKAGVALDDIVTGQADPDALRKGGDLWRPIAARLAIIQGDGNLTVPRIRGRALQAMARMRSKQCLIVVDYLQLMAKASIDLRSGFQSVRERVEALGTDLRQLAVRLHSPVLALSSQSRAGGQYATGGGQANLDSLKESGDLEYMCDAALFLTADEKRQAEPPSRALRLTVRASRESDTGSIPLIYRPDVAIMREEARM